MCGKHLRSSTSKINNLRRKQVFVVCFPSCECLNLIKDIEYIFSNPRSEQLWAPEEHLEELGSVLYNDCHLFNQCEMIKSCREAGFWLKCISFSRVCDLTLSRLGADLTSRRGRCWFGAVGGPPGAGRVRSQHGSPSSPSVDSSGLTSTVLEFLTDS